MATCPINDSKDDATPTLTPSQGEEISGLIRHCSGRYRRGESCIRPIEAQNARGSPCLLLLPLLVSPVPLLLAPPSPSLIPLGPSGRSGPQPGNEQNCVIFWQASVPVPQRRRLDNGISRKSRGLPPKPWRSGAAQKRHIFGRKKFQWNTVQAQMFQRPQKPARNFQEEGFKCNFLCGLAAGLGEQAVPLGRPVAAKNSANTAHPRSLFLAPFFASWRLGVRSPYLSSNRGSKSAACSRSRPVFLAAASV